MGTFLSRKNANFLIFLCWFAYTITYVGRLNYNASMVEIISDLSVDKAEAGLVSSFFFFAYGIGQIINGILSKKYNTKIMIAIALVSSGVINFLIPFCTDISIMKYLWLVNGAVQSILWCSIIKTQANYLPKESLPKAVFAMSTTAAIGTFAVYALSALFSHFGNWRIIFYLSSVLLITVAVVWFLGMKSIENSVCVKEMDHPAPEPDKPEKGRFFDIITVSAVIMCFLAIANGFVKDGVTTWVPNILYEEFGVSKSLSIILTLLLPLLSIFGASIVALIRRKIRSSTFINSILYGTSSLLLLSVILILPLKNVPLTMLLFMGITCAMAGVSNIITSIIPLSFREKADSGLIAGILNAFAYFGSTLSITLLGLIADNSSWKNVFICILIFSSVAFALGYLSLIIKKRNKKDKVE